MGLGWRVIQCPIQAEGFYNMIKGFLVVSILRPQVTENEIGVGLCANVARLLGQQLSFLEVFQTFGTPTQNLVGIGDVSVGMRQYEWVIEVLCGGEPCPPCEEIVVAVALPVVKRLQTPGQLPDRGVPPALGGQMLSSQEMGMLGS